MGMTMSARVTVAVPASDGHPALPQSLTVQGQTVPIWSARYLLPMGAYTGYEYRHPSAGRLVALVPIAATASGMLLTLAFVPAEERDGPNTTYDQLSAVLRAMSLLKGSWLVEADGTVPLLDVDNSAWAVEAKNAWPATWRERLDTDDPGDPINGVAPAPATGERQLAISL